MHWTAKTAIGTVITVVVTGVLIAEWSVYQDTRKIPSLEVASAKQQKDIAYLKVMLTTLMQQTGHPPKPAELEKLMSTVGEFGASSAQLVMSAQIGVTDNPLASRAWVPESSRVQLRDAIEHAASGYALS